MVLSHVRLVMKLDVQGGVQGSGRNQSLKPGKLARRGPTGKRPKWDCLHLPSTTSSGRYQRTSGVVCG